MTNPRQLAFIALRDVHKGAYADVALDRVLQKVNLADCDRRLMTELIYGSVRRQRTLDTLIDQFAKKKSHQQPQDLRTICIWVSTSYAIKSGFPLRLLLIPPSNSLKKTVFLDLLVLLMVYYASI